MGSLTWNQWAVSSECADVMHILETKQDMLKIGEKEEAFGNHANIRGADFYH